MNAQQLTKAPCRENETSSQEPTVHAKVCSHMSPLKGLDFVEIGNLPENGKRRDCEVLIRLVRGSQLKYDMPLERHVDPARRLIFSSATSVVLRRSLTKNTQLSLPRGYQRSDSRARGRGFIQYVRRAVISECFP